MDLKNWAVTDEEIEMLYKLVEKRVSFLEDKPVAAAEIKRYECLRIKMFLFKLKKRENLNS